MSFITILSEKAIRLAEEQDRIRLEEMSEDEYDALGDEEKAAVDRKRLDIKKERIKKFVGFLYICFVEFCHSLCNQTTFHFSSFQNNLSSTMI